MLKKRVITSILGIPVLIAAVWFNAPLPWFTVLAAVCGILAASEFYRLVSSSKGAPLTFLGLLLTLLFILSPHFKNDFVVPLLLTSSVVLPLIWFLMRPQKEGAFVSWAWTIAGIFYVGWLMSYLVALRQLENGRNWVFFALFITFASDTSAFFIGRAFGKRRLAPSISPSKTWEGAVAGVFGAIIVSLLFTLQTPFGLPLNYGQAILLGGVVSIFSQLGDLIESLFKRNMGVKDSGMSLPGHGGFLDRMDSILFAGIAVYYYALLPLSV